MPLSNDEVREHLRGVAAGLLTPFDADLEVEHEKLKANARSLYDSGIRTFLASANISEYHSLSRDERVEVTRSSVDALPPDACILAGVGGSTKEAKDTIRSYDRVGVDAMMVMPPDHSFIHEQGLIRYYEKLDAVPYALFVRTSRGSTRWSNISRFDERRWCGRFQVRARRCGQFRKRRRCGC